MKKGLKQILCAMLIAGMMLNPVAASASEVNLAGTESTVETVVVESAAEEVQEESAEAVEEETESAAEETKEEDTVAVDEEATEAVDETESSAEVDASTDPQDESAEAAKEGLVEEEGLMYYYQNGEKVTGLQTLENGLYYFDPEADGAAAIGYKEIVNEDGSKTFYYFKQDGTAFNRGMLTFEDENGTKTMYFKADGTAGYGYAGPSRQTHADLNGNLTEEVFESARKYYFQKEDGQAFTDGFLKFVHKGKTYNFYFGQDGAAEVGYKSATVRYIADAEGNMTSETGTYRSYFKQNKNAFYTGLLQFTYNGKTYYFYFGEDGLAEYKNYYSTNVTYKADEDGVVASVKGFGRYYIDNRGRAFTGGHLRFVKADTGKSYTFYFTSNGKAFSKGYGVTTTQNTADIEGNITNIADGTKRYYYFQPKSSIAYYSGYLRFVHTNGKTYNFYYTEDGSALVSATKSFTTRRSADASGNITNISDGSTYTYKFAANGIGTPMNAWVKVGSTWTYYSNGAVKFSSNAMYNAWSKIKSRSSSTKYYVVVDTTNCLTFTFEGKANNWTPKFMWKCGPGTNATPTVKGTFSVGGRGHHFDGKNGANYTCYYYTQFYGNYLFHSILYYRSSWTVRNATLGRKVSHGCVRLATDNAYWFYKNLPNGTKVYIY